MVSKKPKYKLKTHEFVSSDKSRSPESLTPCHPEARSDVERRHNVIPEISPAHSTLDNFKERMAPPEVEFVPRLYSQKDDKTPIKDLNLGQMTRNLSIRAANAWNEWASELEDPLELLLLDEDEYLSFVRCKRIVFVEDTKWEREEIKKLEAGFREIPSLNSCKLGIQKRTSYSPSYDDRQEQINRSDYETNIWRVPQEEKDEDLVPNCGYRDDPDYINPSSLSRPFASTKLARRRFNCWYLVTFRNGDTMVEPPDCSIDKHIRTSNGTWQLIPGRKDYASASSIAYRHGNQGRIVDNVEVARSRRNQSSDKNSNHEGEYGEELCSWEIDLRISPGTIPNPTKYQKLDPDREVGNAFLRSLDRNTHLWNEYSWDYRGSVSSESQKKVALYISVKNVHGQDKCIWVYIDDSDINMKKNPFSRRKVFPQIRFSHYLRSEKRFVLDKNKQRIPLVAELKFFKNYNASDKIKLLKNDGFKLIKNRTYTDYFGVTYMLFFRRDLPNK